MKSIVIVIIYIITSCSAYGEFKNISMKCISMSGERRTHFNMTKYTQNMQCEFVEEIGESDITVVTSIIGIGNYQNLSINLAFVYNEFAFPQLMPVGIGRQVQKNSGQRLKSLSIMRQHFLRTIKRENFANMTYLERLVLRNTQIEDIPYDTFYDLLILKSLDIQWNKIHQLHSDVLVTMPKLEILLLNYNPIEVIEAGVLRFNINLKEIELHFDNLKNVKVDFTKFSKLKRIELGSVKTKCKIREVFYSKDSNERTRKIGDFQKKVRELCRVD